MLIGPESRSKIQLNCHLFSVQIAKLNSTIKCQLLLIRVCRAGSHPKPPITERTRLGSFPLSNLMYVSLNRTGSVTLKTNVNRNLQDLCSDQDIDVSQKMEAKKKKQVKPSAANTTWNRLSSSGRTCSRSCWRHFLTQQVRNNPALLTLALWLLRPALIPVY